MPRTRRTLAAAAVIAGLAIGGYASLAIAYKLYSRAGSDDFPMADGFESGDLRHWSQLGARQLCCDHSAVVVPDGARQGDHALRITLNRSDGDVRGSKRAEFRLKSPAFGTLQRHGFSTFLPADWQTDAEPVTLAQWHNVPDKLFGEGSMSPPLRLLVRGDREMVVVRWDPHPLSRHPLRRTRSDETTVLWEGPITPGQWTDWTFDVSWSWQRDGQIRVWRNGELVAERIGPNTYNDWIAPYFKFGVYVPGWTRPAVEGGESVDTRTVLFDAVRVDTPADPSAPRPHTADAGP